MDFLPISNDEVFTILRDNHNYYLTLSARKTHATKNEAAKIIQNAWKSHKNRRIYRFMRNKLIEFTNDDPVRMLRRVSVFEAKLFEKKYGHCLVFRLAGSQFPPVIVYKVFIGCQRNIGNGDKKNVFKHWDKYTWDTFYVYKSINERAARARRKRRKTSSKRKNTGIQWIQTMY